MQSKMVNTGRAIIMCVRGGSNESEIISGNKIS